MKDLTLSHVTPTMETKYANAQMPQNMVLTVTKLVLASKLKSIKLELVANVPEPKLEPNF